MLKPVHWVNSGLKRAFPELRVFLRSDSDTRFIRLSPVQQAVGWAGCVLLVGWTVIATAVLLTDTIGSGKASDQAAGERPYPERSPLSTAMPQDHERFSAAQERISTFHSALLESESRRRELEAGFEVIQATLRRAINERDAMHEAGGSMSASTSNTDVSGSIPSLSMESLEFLTSALHRAADDRDALNREAAEARRTADIARHDLLNLERKTDRIFSQLEEAVSISVEPLDRIFSSVGLSSEKVLNTVRRGYSGRGGPLTPLRLSSYDPHATPDTLRAIGILERLNSLSLYRLAMEKIPLAMPVKGNFHYTSGFGPRWGRFHYGLDLAAKYGKPIHATADGVVTFAGWRGDYGRLVQIQHEFGIETRYAHLAKVRVKKGQRVSHGDRIGDMGSSGRSTGTHLHYEIRVDGKAINPMIYIRASRNVF